MTDGQSAPPAVSEPSAVETLLRRLPALEAAAPADALACYEELSAALDAALDERSGSSAGGDAGTT